MIELGKAHSTQANFTLSGVELAVPDTYTFLTPDAFDDIPIDVEHRIPVGVVSRGSGSDRQPDA